MTEFVVYFKDKMDLPLNKTHDGYDFRGNEGRKSGERR